MTAERRHEVGLDLRLRAAFEAEQVDVVRRACGHAVKLNRMTAPSTSPRPAMTSIAIRCQRRLKTDPFSTAEN